MNKVDFCQLSAEGQRVAIQQHVLKVARDTLDGMLKRTENVEGIFWLEPLRRGREESMEVETTLGADESDWASLGSPSSLYS
jgi:hypothetical protein